MNIFERHFKTAINYVLIISFSGLLSACGGGVDDGTENQDPNSNNTVVVPKWAYVVNELDDTVSQFSIGAEGKLTPLNPEAVLTGDSPRSITVDPSGKFVYVANGDGKISQYRIGTEAGQEGALIDLGSANPTVSDSTPSLRSIVIDPSGKYAYAANAGNTTDAIWQFSIGSDGRLTRLTNAQPGSSVQSIVLDPSGHYAYALNEANNTVTQFSIDSDGTLKSMGPAFVYTGSAPYSFAFHPTKPYAYVANSQGDNLISEYKFTDGKLDSNGTFLRGALGGQPLSITVTPSGRYAYVANTGSNTDGSKADAILRFSIGADGKLVSLGNTTNGLGLTPQSITVDPSGKYAYVVNAGDDTVSQYLVGTDGTLISQGSVTVLGKAKPAGLKNHPIGIATTQGPDTSGGSSSGTSSSGTSSSGTSSSGTSSSGTSSSGTSSSGTTSSGTTSSGTSSSGTSSSGTSSSGTSSSGTSSSGTSSSGTTSSGTSSSGTTSSGTTSSGTTSSGTTSSGTTSSGTTSSGTTSSGTTSSGTTSSGTTSSGTTSSGTTSSGTTSSGTTSSGTSSGGGTTPTSAWVVGSWSMSDPIGVSGYASVNSDLNIISGSTLTAENCGTMKTATSITPSSTSPTCAGLFPTKTWKVVTPPGRGNNVWVCEGSGTYSGKNISYIYPSTDGKTCDVSSTLGAIYNKVTPGTYGTATLKLWYISHWYSIVKISGHFDWKSSSPDQASFTGGWVSTDLSAPTTSGIITGTIKKTGAGTFNWADPHDGVVHTTGVFKKL